eukprot:gene10077-11107_t
MTHLTPDEGCDATRSYSIKLRSHQDHVVKIEIEEKQHWNLEEGKFCSQKKTIMAEAAPLPRKKAKKVKYNGHELNKKGIILEIDNMQQSQFKKVKLTFITGDELELGLFHVTAKFMGVTVQKEDLDFQDLLQLQDKGASDMKMFGVIKLDVDLLVSFIKKKFPGHV